MTNEYLLKSFFTYYILDRLQEHISTKNILDNKQVSLIINNFDMSSDDEDECPTQILLF